jgi:hypothetical protein
MATEKAGVKISDILTSAKTLKQECDKRNLVYETSCMTYFEKEGKNIKHEMKKKSNKQIIKTWGYKEYLQTSN